MTENTPVSKNGVDPYQPPVAQSQVPASRSGMAVTGLVLGVIALATSFLPIVNNLSFVLAGVGVVFAIVGVVATRRGKKRGKGMAVASVVLNVAALAIVLATQSMFSAAIDDAMVSTEEVAGAASEPTASTAEEKYTIEGETMVSDSYSTKIAGTLTNNTDKEIGYLQLSYTLYDADGAQLGSAFANVSNLEAGGVWKFEAVAFESGVATYKLADVTGF